LNYGIGAAYPREVQAVVERSISGGRPNLAVKLMDGGKEPVDPENAHGGGLAQILGFLARVVIVMATGKRRILFLDECFSAVSGDLLSDLSALIRAIVDQLDFQIILVTHQPELADAANIIYRVKAPGVIEQINGEDL
jgi:ABC-type thiamine transport system ATPase subunit